MSFKDDIIINIHTLDKNSIDQVDLYEEWSTKWADAEKEKDEAKENLSVIKAEADEEVRKNPDKFGWGSDRNPTEPWVANKIVSHEKVREASTILINAQHNANVMKIAKETLDHRSRSLDRLTDLYKGQYFVSHSRIEERYTKAVTNEGKEAQSKALEDSSRLRKRRPIV